jgi:hypothetical protein
MSRVMEVQAYNQQDARRFLSPCHDRVVTGGPSMVWCPACGRVFQADDPRLTLWKPKVTRV